MTSRRTFIKTATAGTAGLCIPSVVPILPDMSSPKISLAQWSLHRALFDGKITPIDFPMIAYRDFGITAVEYVNQFYKDKISDIKYWGNLRQQTDDMGISNVLIMVDDEGLLGDPDKKQRDLAVANHFKWAEIAHKLGCHSIRVNAFGIGGRDMLRANLTESLANLTNLTQAVNISVLIENHGFHTSDAAFITSIIRDVNLPGLGTLPDFGNWCLNAEWGSTQDGNCSENYGPEHGLSEFLPFAKGISAKSYDFDAQGLETRLPYQKLLQLVKSAGYTGYIGIEYEGNRLTEYEGIRATRSLVEQIWSQLPK